MSTVLPDSVRFLGIIDLLWAPYNDDSLIINCATALDTGQRSVFGLEAYLINWHDQSIYPVHPTTFPEFGADYQVLAWLPGSHPGSDSLLIYQNQDAGPFIHVLQSGENIIPIGILSEIGFLSYSNDGRYLLQRISPDMNLPFGKLLLNGVEIRLPQPILVIDRVSWSPDGSKVALVVLPGDAGSKYTEVWILHVREYLTEQKQIMPVDRIDFQRRYCRYNYGGIYAEYLTDSTLAVAMHHDGDDASTLWEIQENGDGSPAAITRP
jgi:hypothetical protein